MRYLELDIRTPIEHITSGQLIANERWTHTRRTLNTHVLLIVQEGVLYIEQGGIQYEVQPGQAMLLLALEEHAGYRHCDPGLSYYWCHFQTADGHVRVVSRDAGAGLPEDSRVCAGAEDEQLPTIGSPRIQCAEYMQCENLSRLIVQMKQLLHIANSDLYSRYAADYCLTSLLIELARQCAHASGERKRMAWQPEHGQMKRFVEVLEWIRVHRAEPMTASGVADIFNYNADYLSYLCKRNTGLSLIKYIHDMKISEAREKLLSTDLSIRQLSYALGFKDEKYFSKLFRMYEGITPSKYRAAYYRTHTNKQ